VNATRKGLLVGAIQIALVLSLAGKLLYDRMTRPRVWVLSAVYDPELPIRGRYIGESLRFPAEGFEYSQAKDRNTNEWFPNRDWAYLDVRNGQLIGKKQGSGPGEWVHLQKNNEGTLVAFSEEPVLVFVSEGAELPRLKPGEEMWVEVTIPAKGPPRPIRLGIKKDGVLTPLQLK
jgi:hypothetical protein